ncbi:MAG: phosphatase PAP2 family protein [Egibacteraceae bacterium]
MTGMAERGWPWPLLVVTGSVLAFVGLAEEVVEREGIVLDVARIPVAAMPRPLGLLMTFFTLAGGGVGALLIVAGISAVLLSRRRFHDTVFLVTAFQGARLIGLALKETFSRPRPDTLSGAASTLPVGHELVLAVLVGIVVLLGLFTRRRQVALLLAGTFAVAVAVDRVAKWSLGGVGGHDSFPSGHAVTSMALVAALLVLAWPMRWRWAATAAGALFVTGVGFSRLYFGFHYPSDVLGGWCLALAWVAGVWLLFHTPALASRQPPSIEL